MKPMPLRHLWKRINWLLVVVMSIAAILRLYQLGSVPVHLTPDEAALGYNAFSILETGRDEWGKRFPIVFRSFGDYKPGLYVYLTMPFVAIGGLNETMVRLPSALVGIGSVYLLYVLMTQLFPELKWKVGRFEMSAATLSAMILAITPWHVLFSRGAWEANVAVFEMLVVLIGLFKFLKTKKARWLYMSAVTAGLSLWTYQGAKIAIVLLLVAWLVVYVKELLAVVSKQQVAIAFGLGLFVAMPIVWGLVQGQGGRLSVFSVFSYTRSDAEIAEQVLMPGGIERGSLWFSLFFNEGVAMMQGILRRYFNYFSGRFLFFEGDWHHPQMSLPYMGMLLWGDIIGMILGILVVARKNLRAGKFFLLWLALIPLAGALSRDEINAVRTLPMVIPLVGLSGIGWLRVIGSLHQGFVKLAALCVCVGIYGFGVFFMVDSLFVVAPKKTAVEQYFGYKQVAQLTNGVHGPVVMDQSYDQPYIYFAFYNQIEPRILQSEKQFEASEYGDVGLVSQIGDQLYFEPVNVGAELENGSGALVTWAATELTEEYKVAFEKHVVLLPNKAPRFNVYLRKY